MNSWSQNNSNKNHSKECAHPIPGKVLFNCSNGNLSFSNILLPENNMPQNLNQPMASVTMDTTLLCNPKLLINFSGILTVTPLDNIESSIFTFALFRICPGIKVREPITTFSFNYMNFSPSFPESRTLKLEYLYCNGQCESCCTYILELTSISSLAALTANISINGLLSILAIEDIKNENC